MITVRVRYGVRWIVHRIDRGCYRVTCEERMPKLPKPDDRRILLPLTVPEMAMLTRYAAIGSALAEAHRGMLVHGRETLRTIECIGIASHFATHSAEADLADSLHFGEDAADRWNALTNRMIALARAADPDGDFITA
jgi:hypothetical protein